MTLIERIRAFSGEFHPRLCEHDHKLQGTGAVFYQSTGLLQCALCGGWQLIRKPVS
ncbi:hypothetical protein D3C85_1401480 [compost metagenome]